MILQYFVALDRKSGAEHHFALDSTVASNDAVLEATKGLRGSLRVFRNIYTGKDPQMCPILGPGEKNWPQCREGVEWHDEGISIVRGGS